MKEKLFHLFQKFTYQIKKDIEIVTRGGTEDFPSMDNIIIDAREAKERFVMRSDELDFLAYQLFDNWKLRKSNYIQLLKEWNECIGYNSIEGLPSLLTDIDDTIFALEQVKGGKKGSYDMSQTDLALLIDFLKRNKEHELKVWEE